ncbi:hypothetical protein GCM10022405_18490 [Gibbsiella dentisursi]|uniref:Uncharacterized protein n=1 Tax=Gibbsiella dentisursi TaxID=796890 RepID=A0ABP7L1N3_9GAMM
MGKRVRDTVKDQISKFELIPKKQLKSKNKKRANTIPLIESEIKNHYISIQ